MSTRKILILLGTLIMVAVVMTACGAGEPGPQGPAGPAGPQGEPGAPALATDLTCTECHNDTTLITGKKAAWNDSIHGSGEAFVRGSSNSCAGCHSGGAFSEMIAAGLRPDQVESGDPNPTHQDCRTCHQIHTTYTGDDWALETEAPVTFFAYEGVTFDGGKGNLCANCHQPRRAFSSENGQVDWNSVHYGPHHGPHSAMLLGIAGAGVEGKPSAHATLVENTCVTCHVGENDDHSFEPNISACQTCHADAENFDINGVQTEIAGMIEELKEALIAKGMLTEEDEPVVGVYPEAQAAALWNYVTIAHEDRSMGVHNPSYVNALIEYSLEALAE
jgi:hypothetical protein